MIIKSQKRKERPNMTKKILSLVLALALVLSCVSFAAAEEAAPDTYSMINSFDITTLDYVYNNKSSNGDYTCNFIEGLLTQDSHGKLIPGMAKEWSHNEDASEWTFIIRDDAVWSTNEGEVYDKVKAEDFVTGMKHAVATQSETLSLVEDLIVGLKAYIEGTGTWDDVGIKADGMYLSPVAGALYSMTVGRMIAFATPWGVSYSAPRGCAME